ncbi:MULTISPECIES: ArsR/SmtB family transcription factor [Cetobacterium]|uniref:Metalloregulator ArsR/SmtB family transcription factor n=1 Tax=Candidatus Cetobacterium colombiensis TaxID=3073100 RepID=A0ABU4WBJ7_9FUSO|nr:metalloregulator ArsR/SmtB family transcription factor [Candidatus Cetobacterium colombiensis]MDX8336918.1 metalloregulator ArsR/SmtB family transcription factor [Candidatus Cetobacterium colombiensis]
MEKQLKILKALSHPLRVEIIYALKDQKSKCVCELEKLKEVTSQSSLSQHLKILRDANLVKTEKIGGWVHYSIKNPNIFEILEKIREI